MLAIGPAKCQIESQVMIYLFLRVVLVKLFLLCNDRAPGPLKVTRWSQSLKSRPCPVAQFPSSLISGRKEGVEGEAPLFTRRFVPWQELELNVEITLCLNTLTFRSLLNHVELRTWGDIHFNQPFYF